MFGPQVGSRDLSQNFTGTLHVTIQGVGEYSIEALPGGETISSLVSQAKVWITGEASNVRDVHNSPWSVVSFDADKKAIIVQPV